MRAARRVGRLLCLLAALPPAAAAAGPPGHEGALGAYPMDREASGTSWQPEKAGMDGLHAWTGSWRLMVHAEAFGVFTRQGGPRGGEQAFSTNMAMAAATRLLAGGAFTVRAMGSLEPLLGPRGYRLLLQTGETADGRTHLVDYQHPHDLAMELAAIYSHPIGGGTGAFVYVGSPGEPALGPPAFMHRGSAEEIPVAPLAHHWLDSTHISFGVVTAGLVRGPAKLEASVFNGHEPDAHRWNIERPRLDSWAARFTLNPRPWLSAQVSLARLRGPEILHPLIDVRRTTASVSYAGGGRRRMEATVAWGRNLRSADLPTNCPLLFVQGEFALSCAASPGPPFAPSRRADAFLGEAVVHLGRRHAVFARAERIAKDELFPASDPFQVRVFPIASVQGGYRYELPVPGRVRLGVGAAGAVALLPEFLANEYGRRPLSYWIFGFVRLR